MKTPMNPFKKAMADKRVQYGLWSSMLAPIPTEISAAAGFDWLLLDGEHSPNTPHNFLQQSQILAGYPGTHGIARIPMGHGWVGQAMIKQVLDVGIQTILVPMVETAEQARELVRCMRYPPQGIRGMAGVRASGWGRNVDYAKEANDQVCLLVQAETRAAIQNLDAIAAVDGVDGVFIGPNDLAANMGYLGNMFAPDVKAAVRKGVDAIRAAGKAAGLLNFREDDAKELFAAGVGFIAVAGDASMLARQTERVVQAFKQ
jgi:4-hydroxy-2-oxoheptanedioate aldolase